MDPLFREVKATIKGARKIAQNKVHCLSSKTSINYGGEEIK
jgi:hypothetical protein